MVTTPAVLEMLGDGLKDAVVAAQARLADDTVMARCEEGLWLVERNETTLQSGLTYAAAIAAVEALT